MEIDFENIFIVSMIFGMVETSRIVFASDKTDAINTITQMYDNPQIGFIISYSQINDLYEVSKQINDKIFIFVLEMKKGENKNEIIETIEWTHNVEELHLKYAGRDYIFCDKEFIEGLVLETDNMLKNPKDTPLISSNIII